MQHISFKHEDPSSVPIPPSITQQPKETELLNKEWVSNIFRIINGRESRIKLDMRHLNSLIDQNVRGLTSKEFDLLIQCVEESLKTKSYSIIENIYAKFAENIREDWNIEHFPEALKIELIKKDCDRILPHYLKNIKILGIKDQSTLVAIFKITQEREKFMLNVPDYCIDQQSSEGQAAMADMFIFQAKQVKLEGLQFHGIIDKDKDALEQLIRAYNQDIAEPADPVQKKLIEVFKKEAKKDAIATLKKMHALILENSPDRVDENTPAGRLLWIEVLKLGVHQNGHVQTYIQFLNEGSCGLSKTKEGQKGLIEIAKVVAAKDNSPWSRVESTRDVIFYGITEESAKLEIIQIAFRHSSPEHYVNLLSFMKDFINGPNLIKLRELIPLYTIGDMIELSKKEVYEIMNEPLSENELMTLLKLNDRYKQISDRIPYERQKDLSSIAEEIKNLSKKMIKGKESGFPELVDKVIQLEQTSKLPPRELFTVQCQQLGFLTRAIADLSKFDEGTVKNRLVPILETELGFQSPKLRIEIWNFLLLHFNRNFLESLNNKNKETRNTPHTVLPNIFLAVLENEGVNCQGIARDINLLRIGKTKLFKDAALYKLLLKVLLELSKEPLLDAKEKQQLLEKVLSMKTIRKGKEIPDKEGILKAFKSIKGILDLHQGERLKVIDSIPQSHLLQELGEIHFQAFNDVIPIGQTTNFLERLESLFAKFRDPDTILLYASSINSLDTETKAKVFQSLASFIQNALQENFPASRYENSKHLDTVFGSKEGLKELWKKGAVMAFDASEQEYSGWTIEDTDDFVDLFMCGTEISGSCQHIQGDPDSSKCLLAYVDDGKNRLLAIKDSTGTIKARAILRLLWDPKNKQPVLFLERIYPKKVSRKFEEALVNLAKNRSETLGLDLLSKDLGIGKPYPGTILSEGSRARYEYVDAGDGIYEDGIFSIEKAHFLS